MNNYPCFLLRVYKTTYRREGFSFLIILLFPFVLSAQKTNNVWAFGDGAGLNFNTNPVSPFKSQLKVDGMPYFAAAASDKQGNLMFYTDGFNVWNRDNLSMPKYGNFWPWSNESIIPLICPYPQNDSLFYLFGVGKGKNANKLIYLTVRLNKSGDLEEVVYPRPSDAVSYFKVLTENASLLLTGTAHCNQRDVWMVTHTAGGLLSYLVTQDGVHENPVVTPLASSIIPGDLLEAKNSNIKFSANGEKLIFPLLAENKIVIFDFDNATGLFSNPIKLALPDGKLLEDAEISPDANMLYVGAYEVIIYGDGNPSPDMHYIYQYDLQAGDAEAIAGSLFLLNGFGDRVSCVRTCFLLNRTMQLGPDGKIYVNMRYSNEIKLDLKLSVIEDPNKKKTAARYRKNLVNLGTVYKFINYNYIRSGSFSLRENGIKIKQRTCANNPVDFALLYNKADSVKWDFGDLVSGANNYSNLFTPQHIYPKPGTYTVTAIIYTKCNTDTATRQAVIEPTESVHVPQSIRDTIMCVGNGLTLDASTSLATSYEWDNGLIYPYRTFDTPGRYTITVFNSCSVERKEFTIKLEECKCLVFVPNAFTPNNDGLNDTFKPSVQCAAKDYKFRVYNRWGGICYESSESTRGWSGKIGQSAAPSGVYIWSLQYRNPNNNETLVKHGNVLLMR